VLRQTGLVVTGTGAVGAAALFFRAGQHSPQILIVLIGIWVFVPFAAMAAMLVWSIRRPARTLSILSVTTLVVVFCTLAIYIYDAFHPRAQAAFVYVMVPPASVIALAIALVAATRSSRTAGTASNSSEPPRTP
jgi:hypothetical protein